MSLTFEYNVFYAWLIDFFFPPLLDIYIFRHTDIKLKYFLASVVVQIVGAVFFLVCLFFKLTTNFKLRG